MIKGIFVALGIMLLVALIPIVDFVGIPFGAFIGALLRYIFGSVPYRLLRGQVHHFRRLVGVARIADPGGGGGRLDGEHRPEPTFRLAPVDGRRGFYTIHSQHGSLGGHVLPAEGLQTAPRHGYRRIN